MFIVIGVSVFMGIEYKKYEISVEEKKGIACYLNNQDSKYIAVLEIPKINLKRGFLDINSRYNNVKYNVTVIKGSTFPGEPNNNLILAAHSGVCSICYFDKLFNFNENKTEKNVLVEGDVAVKEDAFLRIRKVFRAHLARANILGNGVEAVGRAHILDIFGADVSV